MLLAKKLTLLFFSHALGIDMQIVILIYCIMVANVLKLAVFATFFILGVFCFTFPLFIFFYLFIYFLLFIFFFIYFYLFYFIYLFIPFIYFLSVFCFICFHLFCFILF